MKRKDPFDLTPEFLIRRGSKLPRWQHDWFASHRTINYSGLVCELITQFIQEYDPEYYEKYKHLVKNEMRRKETTPVPKIKSVLVHTGM